MKTLTPLLLGLLCACSSTAPPQDPAPEPILFAFGDIETQADGRCFATARGPDRFETVIRQVEVIPETRAADGRVLNPAIFRNEAQRVRIPSDDIQRFETVCPPTYSLNFVASLQRALLARGEFTGAITGLMDAPTSTAIQLYQERRGLNSPILALETAQTLGLVAVDNE